jgi:hypothetical protein
VVAVSLAVAVVGLAIAGFIWLTDAFRSSPEPAEPLGSNYVFSNLTLEGSTLDGEVESFMIRFEVSWSDETSPGVHRCKFRLIDEEGDAVGERIDWVLWDPSGNVAVDVTAVRDARPASADARCDPQRLDTPGIAVIEESIVPTVDDEGRIEDISEELNRRIDAWSQRFSIGSMSQDELAANVTALRGAWPGSRDYPNADFEELIGRIGRLCALVEPGVAVRGC